MVLLMLEFVCLPFGVFTPINYIDVQVVDAWDECCAGAVSRCDTELGESVWALISGDVLRSGRPYNIFVSAGNAAIIVFAVVFGFASGAYVSLAPALVDDESDCGAILQGDGSSYTGIKDFSGVTLLVGTGCDGGESGPDG
ncbi:hypothetical protein IFM61606_05905 [Aspergillus udagawae]|uniref:Uncharacterized protein n=1 Tax=Aspergillus udagawae TaxID=91492 RepID=A0ABQ1APB8_9EURO|nr:hypothetical protein IFM51744_06035 [Aspergillus udagawae]GFF85616.1 hypothetical protein IFM53868_04539 [Aspergillus udagawae]GFG06250.1 hypothetical protein IFM5058_02827 [Aspergillus udagawae]GFG25943.1 hypothetical protein IFM61606_05905 [Aspergillus udagawae]